MDPRRVDQVIQFVLLTAGQQDEQYDRELGPIHLVKYVYLADLAYAERNGGATFTGTPWRFYHYGPWAAPVWERIQPATRAIDAVERTFSSRYDNDIKRWSKVDDALLGRLECELPSVVASIVKRYVRQFGKDTAELLHFVYTTAPMLRAAPNESLVFEASPMTTPAPNAPTLAPLSHKAQKRAEARLKVVKQRVNAKRATKKARAETRALTPPPRYDAVFFEGVKQLDALDGDPVQSSSGEIEVDNSVWKSPTRGEPRD